MPQTSQPSVIPVAPRRAWLLRAVSLGACAMLGLTGPGRAQSGPQPPTLTILDGSGVLIRGAGKFELGQGLRLATQDIVETAPDARLVRIEFSDGLAISLGPASRLLIEPRFIGERGRAARLYLLSGWIKLNLATPTAGSKPAPAGPALLATPAFDLISATGVMVAQVQPGRAQAFVEAGMSSVQERDNGQSIGSVQSLRTGEFFGRSGSAKSATLARPAADFVQALPRSFLDTLPSRAALFKDRDMPPKPLGEFGYADVRDWLSAEPALRRAAMPRWRPLTRNLAFRNALVANMPAHPEWDRVLFPEKYLPKPAASAAPGGSGGTLR